jgi:hypothetical protein
MFLSCAPLFYPLSVSAQDAESKPSKTVAALEKLQQEFVEHLEKEKEIKDDYQEVESKLKRTENCKKSTPRECSSKWLLCNPLCSRCK